MEDIKYPIELEVITPLSVGAGNDNEWVKGLDFVQKDDKVYVIDMQKVAAAGVEVETLSTLFLKSDDKGICQLLGNKIGDLSRHVFDLPTKTDNNIKTFLRTQFYDKPLVAGSSIKGSMRSSLFNYLRSDEITNEEVFGTMRDGTDFMRFIRIGDVEMPATILVNTKIFNLRGHGTDWQGGWKHRGTDREGNSHTDYNFNPVGFNTLYECVAPGKKGLGSISLAANAFSLLEKFGEKQSPYANKKKELLSKPISHLFQIINNVTKEYLQKERTFFEKYGAERSDEILDNIDSLLSMIPADGSCCLLKMSAGVGFHSITGDWQFDDYDKTRYWTEGRHAGKKKYKSRKIAEYNHHLQLMGFVSLRVLSQEEASEEEKAIHQRHRNHKLQILENIKQQQAEIQQKQADELARQQAIEVERKRQEEYSNLIQQAKQYYHEEKFDDAIACLEKTKAIYPDRTEAVQMITKCQDAKRNAEFRQKELEEAQEKLMQPLAKVIQKITKANNLVSKTTQWLNVEGHSWGGQELSAFLDVAKRLPSKEKKKLPNRISEIAQLLSKEQADVLSKELETI